MTLLIKGQTRDIRDTADICPANGSPLSTGANDDQLELWNEHHRAYRNSQDRMSPTPLARLLAKDLSRGQRILELGCGSGRDADFLQRQGHSVTATDFSEFVVHENARYASSGAQFSVQDLREPLAFSDGSFDVVYARLSLHYFSHTVTQRVFREIHRILSPSGRILFTCRSINDPLYGEGDELGPDIFRSRGQIRHFFSEEYTRGILSSEEGFTIDYLLVRDEPIYDHRASVLQCFAYRSSR